jgi:hypothetical protein
MICSGCIPTHCPNHADCMRVNHELIHMENLATDPLLPSWITYRGYGYYTIDVQAAQAAGIDLPIDLSKIEQFKPFFTNPPTILGCIDFKRQSR